MLVEIKKIVVIRVISIAYAICPRGEFKLSLAEFIVRNIEKL